MPIGADLDLVHQFVSAILRGTDLNARIMRMFAEGPLSPIAEPKRTIMRVLAGRLEAWNADAERFLKGEI